MRKLIVGVLRLYKGVVSPFCLPPAATIRACSEYMRQAVEKYGVARGLWMGVKRLPVAILFTPVVSIPSGRHVSRTQVRQSFRSRRNATSLISERKLGLVRSRNGLLLAFILMGAVFFTTPYFSRLRKTPAVPAKKAEPAPGGGAAQQRRQPAEPAAGLLPAAPKGKIRRERRRNFHGRDRPLSRSCFGTAAGLSKAGC